MARVIVIALIFAFACAAALTSAQSPSVDMAETEATHSLETADMNAAVQMETETEETAAEDVSEDEEETDEAEAEAEEESDEAEAEEDAFVQIGEEDTEQDEAEEEAEDEAEDESEDESEEVAEADDEAADEAEEAADEALESQSAVGDGSCLSSFNAATLAAAASTMQKTYATNKVVYDQGKRQFGATAKFSDCSSFVTSVLDSVNYDCLFASGRNTAAMIPLMEARGGFHAVPKVGDIVMWKAHTGIIVQTCTGGEAAMVAMGLSGCKNTGCTTVTSMKTWGEGGAAAFLGFWTPHA